ncbi:MAG: LptF/LptG family permease [Negativicutes bacterium]|nr:LptF/LptG family permease [Negativicutes bacterium]
MQLLDRYLVRELLGLFLFGVCAFSIVFIGGGTMWRIAQYISKYGASGAVVMKLFVYSLPGVVVITFPMAMLLASLLCFGRLSSSHEITAMRAAGRSFYRLALPVLIAALAVSVLAVILKDNVVPVANAAYNHLVHSEVEGNSRPKGQEHLVIVDNSPGLTRLTYAQKFDEQEGSMSPVTVEEFEDDRLVRVQQAEQAIWQEGRWVMLTGIIHDLSENQDRTMEFKYQYMPVTASPSAIPLEQKQPEEMTVTELKQRIALLRLAKTATAVYEIELHQRLTIPLASLVFALIGVPLGVAPHRASSSAGLSISIAIIFIYYVVMTYTTAWAQGGYLPAFFAAWTPNIIGIGAGLFLIHRVGRR